MLTPQFMLRRIILKLARGWVFTVGMKVLNGLALVIISKKAAKAQPTCLLTKPTKRAQVSVK
jgi:hypothetical protein